MSRTLLFATALLTFAPLLAQTRPVFAGEARTHDRFFLRIAPGPGWARNKIESGGEKLEFSGFGGGSDIAVGAVVSPNLAIHGTLFAWGLSDPDVDAGSGGSGTVNGFAAMSAAGGGVTYYFMPANTYVSGSVGVGTFTLEPDGGPTAETDSGFAFELTTGKEWWVGNSWGLGAAAGYIYSSLGEPDVTENWSGHSFSVRFSATFN